MTLHTTGVTLSTAEHPYNFSFPPPSRLSLQIELFGLQPVTLSSVPITGTVPVDFALDASNSGTIEADNSLGGGLTLANRSQSFSGLFVVGTFQSLDVGAKLALGPESVSNRSLSIDRFTPGELTLDSGSLRFTFTGGLLFDDLTGALGTNVLEINLAQQPISFDFSRLGTTTIVATTDDDSSGLDHDGAELNLPLNFTSTMNNITGPDHVSLSGFLYLGSNVTIPELGSFGLASLSLAALGALAVLRRRSA